MAISNIEFWEKSTEEVREQIVKEGLSKIYNFEDSTRNILELLSEKNLFEYGGLIKINTECLEYIEKLKSKIINLN